MQSSKEYEITFFRKGNKQNARNHDWPGCRWSYHPDRYPHSPERRMTPIPKSVVNEFLSTLLWAETLSEEISYSGGIYSQGTPLDEFLEVDDLPRDIVENARQNLENWRAIVFEGTGVDPFSPNAFDGYTPNDVASNVLLTQNRHGAGFWDSIWTHGGSETNTKGDRWPEYLTECSHSLGEFEVEVWSDGEGGLNYGLN